MSEVLALLDAWDLPHAPYLAGAHDRHDLYHKKTERHSAFPLAVLNLMEHANVETLTTFTRSAVELWDDDDAQLAPYLRSACGLCHLAPPPPRTTCSDPEAEPALALPQSN